MTTKNPIVAAAQIRYFDTPEKHNVAKIKKYIALAAQAGADIICFPETCVHKYDFLKIDDVLVQEISRACRDNNIWAIVTDSFTIKNDNYKMALLIDRRGKVRGDYKKINLYGDSVSAGDKVFICQTDFAKIGIAICWDLAFPEIFSKMKKAGAEIVFCPSYWCYEDIAHEKDHAIRERQLLKSLILSRAFENLFYLVYASPLTSEPDLISYSAIASPHRIVKDIKDKEGLIVKEIDLKQIKKFGKVYPNKG